MVSSWKNMKNRLEMDILPWWLEATSILVYRRVHLLMEVNGGKFDPNYPLTSTNHPMCLAPMVVVILWWALHMFGGIL